MADWYVSSAVYATISAFVASVPYTVGQLVKPTAPAVGKEYVFRCTTAGTAGTEPTWPVANNATVTTGGAIFTNVTGQSTFGWGAPAGTLWSIANANSNRPVAGDRVFLSSDHSENITGAITYAFNTSSNYGLIQILSVNRAGSVPPVASDITNGAAITATMSGLQNMNLDAICNMFWQGITFTLTGTASGVAAMNLSSGTGKKSHYFKNCAMVVTIATQSNLIGINASSVYPKVTFDNTTVQFGHVGSYIGSVSGSPFDLLWINTPSAIQGATIPTLLFSSSTSGSLLITCRGVDLSAIVGTIVNVNNIGALRNAILLDSCRIASSVTRLGAPGVSSNASDEVELVNCWDGTNVLNERYTNAGNMITDRSTYLNNGAQDDIGSYSLKLVSAVRSDFAAYPFDAFALDIENGVTGVSKTATVEIISSASLNNNDIRLQLEYMGASGNSLASFIDSLASVLTAVSALPASSNTWNSPPATPVKQLLQVTFTPQRAGRVRGLVRLGKPSTTVWVNPQIAIV